MTTTMKKWGGYLLSANPKKTKKHHPTKSIKKGGKRKSRRCK